MKTLNFIKLLSSFWQIFGNICLLDPHPLVTCGKIFLCLPGLICVISGKDDVFGENPCIYDTIGKYFVLIV